MEFPNRRAPVTRQFVARRAGDNVNRAAAGDAGRQLESGGCDLELLQYFLREAIPEPLQPTCTMLPPSTVTRGDSVFTAGAADAIFDADQARPLRTKRIFGKLAGLREGFKLSLLAVQSG